MARSKKVRKALDLRKQVIRAHKTARELDAKQEELKRSMSENEVKEYLTQIQEEEGQDCNIMWS